MMHLGMSGRFEIDGPTAPADPASARAAAADPKHAHVLFETDAGDTVTYLRPAALWLHGPDRHRRDLTDTRWFARLGPEPLGPGFHAAYLAARLRRPPPGRQDPPARPDHRRRASATSMSARRCHRAAHLARADGPELCRDAN